MGDCCEIEEGAYVDSLLNLEWLRRSLVREEDSIIFSLIERSKYPINSRLYDQSAAPSLLHLFIKDSEAVQAKVCLCLKFESFAFLLLQLKLRVFNPSINDPPLSFLLLDNHDAIIPKNVQYNYHLIVVYCFLKYWNIAFLVFFYRMPRGYYN